MRWPFLTLLFFLVFLVFAVSLFHGRGCSERDHNRDLADTVSDYTMSVVSHVSAMYKAIIKPPRGGTNQAHAVSSQLLTEVRMFSRASWPIHVHSDG